MLICEGRQIHGRRMGVCVSRHFSACIVSSHEHQSDVYLDDFLLCAGLSGDFRWYCLVRCGVLQYRYPSAGVG
jgi:hypothetical protein